MPNHGVSRLERVYSLDALRGLAALSLVFWHWQHFFSLAHPPRRSISRNCRSMTGSSCCMTTDGSRSLAVLSSMSRTCVEIGVIVMEGRDESMREVLIEE